MTQRLSLPDNLYPIEAFFNVLTDEKFLKVLALFAEGKGYNPEDKTCDFPADLAEEEGGPVERFGYIEVWTYANDQEVRVSFGDFASYIMDAVKAQILTDVVNKDIWEVAAKEAVATLRQIEVSHKTYQENRPI